MMALPDPLASHEGFRLQHLLLVIPAHPMGHELE